MKKLFFCLMALAGSVSAQSIITYYPSCDTVRLTASPSSDSYQWSNGETTQRIYLSNTNPNMTISVVTSSGLATIYEPALPALPVTLNVFGMSNGNTWTLVDYDYTGEWNISYYKGKHLLNNNAPNALQWMVFNTGNYRIVEKRNGCIRKSNTITIQ